MDSEREAEREGVIGGEGCRKKETEKEEGDRVEKRRHRGGDRGGGDRE